MSENVTKPIAPLPALNEAMVRDIITQIEAEKIGFDMSTWVGQGWDKTHGVCGTSYCIGGTALLLHSGKQTLNWLDMETLAYKVAGIDADAGFSSTAVEVAAKELMGLTEHEARILFFEDQWPLGLRRPAVDFEDRGEAEYNAAGRKNAITMLHHLIEERAAGREAWANLKTTDEQAEEEMD